MPFDATPVLSPAVQLLRQARARIDEPEKWCQGDFHVGEASCILGAFQGFYDHWRESTYGVAMRAVLSALGHTSVARFNDAPTTTHADVMAVFDRAERILMADERGRGHIS